MAAFSTLLIRLPLLSSKRFYGFNFISKKSNAVTKINIR